MDFKWLKKINSKIVKNSFNFCGYGIPKNVDPKWLKYYIKNEES